MVTKKRKDIRYDDIVTLLAGGEDVEDGDLLRNVIDYYFLHSRMFRAGFRASQVEEELKTVGKLYSGA